MKSNHTSAITGATAGSTGLDSRNLFTRAGIPEIPRMANAIAKRILEKYFASSGKDRFHWQAELAEEAAGGLGQGIALHGGAEMLQCFLLAAEESEIIRNGEFPRGTRGEHMIMAHPVILAGFQTAQKALRKMAENDESETAYHDYEETLSTSESGNPMENFASAFLRKSYVLRYVELRRRAREIRDQSQSRKAAAIYRADMRWLRRSGLYHLAMLRGKTVFTFRDVNLRNAGSDPVYTQFRRTCQRLGIPYHFRRARANLQPVTA